MARGETYEEFVDKFKPKKTTDDCYTPPEVYDVIAGYVEERWGISRENFVRPFYPGGDFESFEYDDGCVVVDNPPFSILSRIKSFYHERGIRFFLFCPDLTALGSSKHSMLFTHIVCCASIVYENGANVKTGFVTNLPTGGIVLESEPRLGRMINDTCRMLRAKNAKKQRKYYFPDNVITAARAQWLAAHDTHLRIYADDCVRISKLDAMDGRGIFGGALLLNDKSAEELAAAERAAAERLAAERLELSSRELKIVEMLNMHADESVGDCRCSFTS